MTVKEILDSAKARMDKSIVVYQDAMAAIRAGRANPKVLDRITVDYYGTPTPLNQVGNVSVPEARMIVIKPWEKSLIKAIEKAIQTSDLGLNPNNDGEVIRLIFPELNAERRKDLTKQVKKLKKDSLITEDDQRKAEEDAQKLTDKAIKEVDAVCAAKEKEIMEV